MPARWQSQILATGNMAVLSPLTTDPDDLEIKTALPNALHFRRGRHYARARNMEVELPIPPSPTDKSKPDWMTVRKAWWSVVDLVYRSANSPMRLLRPHWGKEWIKIRFGGLSARDYVRTVAYKSEIPECLATLEKIGKRQGWTTKDLHKRFSNKLLDDIFFCENPMHA
ncbi:hypothetical protein E4T44_12162 [Aureobasidium sp. EXF-8845]|nr:hypothetical protein E4T45_12036 [Aureobasidium sp. EXF-8846]KAI4796907.1 hypothetical protein E4T44_12162 [Aureobasidium sp. EXF-8845]